MSDPTIPTVEMTAAAFKGPAYAISNFMVHPVSAGLLRLSFIEMTPAGSNPEYRAAVILDPVGARNLAEILLRFAAPKEEPGA